MTELLKNAWLGWRNFTTAGKMAALFLIALLFLWVNYKKVKQKVFLIYTTVSAACCMIPVTAVGLMLYQTKFYDYEWVWSIVPLTAMTGFAVTVFVTDTLKEFIGGDRKKQIAVVLFMVAALILSSGLDRDNRRAAEEQAERSCAAELLEKVQERMGDREIYLWAPREITEYAREWNPAIQVLYGRNMWDSSLDAYAYDTYSDETKALECWMEGDEGEETVSDRECAETAAATGVNCILLPGKEEKDTIECFEEAFQTKAELLGDYYLLIR